MEREVGHENPAVECVDAVLIQRAIYVLNYTMIINSVQADFPKIHNLCEAGRSITGPQIPATAEKAGKLS
jgi:hypothetical protein